MFDINFVIDNALVAIFSKDLFSQSLFLKGGQALRIKEKLSNRFSADIDFSTPEGVTDSDAYFELLREALSTRFYSEGYYLFDFKWVRSPKIPKPESPMFWGGWAVEFKLIENEKRNLPADKLSKQAVIPTGGISPRITLDISEYEYCEAVEKVTVRTTEVGVYSRALLLVEKLRAICQQHPDYKLRTRGVRARDFYDIEQLWQKVIADNTTEEFLDECVALLPKVFEAKLVDIRLLEAICEQGFIDDQEAGWEAVKATVSNKKALAPYEYFVESLKELIRSILPKLIDAQNTPS